MSNFYSAIFWSLSCNQNLNNKNVMCYLCNNEKESVDHLFYMRHLCQSIFIKINSVLPLILYILNI